MEKFNLNLKLEKEDFENFTMTALAKNMTTEQLLECFINDLVRGAYTNGSDERELANDYYNRLDCLAGYDDNSFTLFLANQICVEFKDLKKLLNTFKMIADDFKNQSPKDFDKPEFFVKYNNLNDYYNAFWDISEYEDYKDKFNENAKTFEEAFTELQQFMSECPL